VGCGHGHGSVLFLGAGGIHAAVDPSSERLPKRSYRRVHVAWTLHVMRVSTLCFLADLGLEQLFSPAFLLRHSRQLFSLLSIMELSLLRQPLASVWNSSSELNSFSTDCYLDPWQWIKKFNSTHVHALCNQDQAISRLKNTGVTNLDGVGRSLTALSCKSIGLSLPTSCIGCYLE
jgi:hypothetical protein